MGVNKLCLLIVRRAGDKTVEITELGLGASATHTHTHTHPTDNHPCPDLHKSSNYFKDYHIITKLSSCLLQQLLCSYIGLRLNTSVFV